MYKSYHSIQHVYESTSCMTLYMAKKNLKLIKGELTPLSLSLLLTLTLSPLSLWRYLIYHSHQNCTMTASGHLDIFIGWLPSHWELCLDKELGHASQSFILKQPFSLGLSLFLSLFFLFFLLFFFFLPIFH